MQGAVLLNLADIFFRERKRMMINYRLNFTIKTNGLALYY